MNVPQPAQFRSPQELNSAIHHANAWLMAVDVSTAIFSVICIVLAFLVPWPWTLYILLFMLIMDTMFLGTGFHDQYKIKQQAIAELKQLGEFSVTQPHTNVKQF